MESQYNRKLARSCQQRQPISSQQMQPTPSAALPSDAVVVCDYSPSLSIQMAVSEFKLESSDHVHIFRRMDAFNSDLELAGVATPKGLLLTHVDGLQLDDPQVIHTCSSIQYLQNQEPLLQFSASKFVLLSSNANFCALDDVAANSSSEWQQISLFKYLDNNENVRLSAVHVRNGSPCLLSAAKEASCICSLRKALGFECMDTPLTSVHCSSSPELKCLMEKSEYASLVLEFAQREGANAQALPLFFIREDGTIQPVIRDDVHQGPFDFSSQDELVRYAGLFRGTHTNHGDSSASSRHVLAVPFPDKQGPILSL